LCCKYGLSGQSNMAVVELDSPSGYTVDGEQLNQLPKQVKDLQRVELTKSDTKAAIYFNKIGKTPVCFNVTNQLAFPVADQKPSRIHVFDYYEPKNSIERDYGPRKKRSLEESCSDCWMDTYPSWPEGISVDSARQNGAGAENGATSPFFVSLGLFSSSLLITIIIPCVAWLFFVLT